MNPPSPKPLSTRQVDLCAGWAPESIVSIEIDFWDPESHSYAAVHRGAVSGIGLAG